MHVVAPAALSVLVEEPAPHVAQLHAVNGVVWYVPTPQVHVWHAVVEEADHDPSVHVVHVVAPDAPCVLVDEPASHVWHATVEDAEKRPAAQAVQAIALAALSVSVVEPAVQVAQVVPATRYSPGLHVGDPVCAPAGPSRRNSSSPTSCVGRICGRLVTPCVWERQVGAQHAARPVPVRKRLSRGPWNKGLLGGVACPCRCAVPVPRVCCHLPSPVQVKCNRPLSRGQ